MLAESGALNAMHRETSGNSQPDGGHVKVVRIFMTASGLLSLWSVEMVAGCRTAGLPAAAQSVSSGDSRVVVPAMPPGVKAIEANGTILTYRDSTPANPAHRTPVVFVHGTLTGLDMVPAQFRTFAARGRTLTYSRRFHPPNPPPSVDDTTTYSAALHADDLAAFINATHSGPADVIGSSYGGLVAILLAIRHPDVVHSLVLAEPAAIGALAGTPLGDSLRATAYASLDPVRAMMARGDSTGAVAAFGDVTGGPGSFSKLPPPVQQYLLRHRGELARELAAPVDAWLPVISCDDLSRIRVPTLVMIGAHGQPLFGMASRVVARCIPGARLEMIPNSGHVIAVDNATAFENMVMGFLDAI